MRAFYYADVCTALIERVYVFVEMTGREHNNTITGMRQCAQVRQPYVPRLSVYYSYTVDNPSF